MHHFLMWLIHVFGIDGQTSDNYAFWSGFGPVLFGQFPILAALIVHFKHKNCHVKGCWRIHTAVDPEHNWPACRKHHSLGHKLGAVNESVTR